MGRSFIITWHDSVPWWWCVQSMRSFDSTHEEWQRYFHQARVGFLGPAIPIDHKLDRLA